MLKKDQENVEQRLIIVDADGSSKLLQGDSDIRPINKDNQEDILPSYISLGWKVLNATPFHESSKILVLIQRELRH